MYSKSGKQVKSFPSNLPGGNRNQGGRLSSDLIFWGAMFPHHPAKWWHSHVGRETVTPSLIVSTATPMESSTFLIWCAGMVIRSGTIWHIARFWRHFLPQYYDCDTEFRLAWVQQKFIENQVRVQHMAQSISFACFSYVRSFGSGQESILTVFSPFQSTRSKECDIEAL